MVKVGGGEVGDSLCAPVRIALSMARTGFGGFPSTVFPRPARARATAVSLCAPGKDAMVAAILEPTNCRVLYDVKYSTVYAERDGRCL